MKLGNPGDGWMIAGFAILLACIGAAVLIRPPAARALIAVGVGACGLGAVLAKRARERPRSGDSGTP